MKISSTDWQKLGATDPYWTVLTDDKFRAARITDDARREFFESGEKHIDWVIGKIRSRLDPDFSPVRSLDFGCGVGRVLVPLSRRCADAVGVDVASSMLEEARKNLLERGDNAELVLADDELSALKGSFDFIHSFIVLQHIPASRGERIVAELLGRLRPGGVAALHFAYKIDLSRGQRLFQWARQRAPYIGRAWNVVKRRDSSTPYIEVYEYDLGRVSEILRAGDCGEFYAELLDHGGVKGILLFCVKRATE